MDPEGNCKKYALVILLLTGVSGLASDSISEATASGVGDYPAPRFAHSMVYDAESDRIIMFGGLLEPAPTWSDETWAYDFNTNTWTNMKPAVRPSPRHGPGMAYDSESDRIILFGGTMRGELFGDTWAYDFNTNMWTNMSPATAPSPRSALDYSMTYDSESDRVILFGGYLPTHENSNQTWAYDYNTNTWTQMQPDKSPVGGRPITYDAESDRIILFGGAPGFNQLIGETWAYDHNANTWSMLEPVVEPSPRSTPLSYDSESDRVVIFSGKTGTDIHVDIPNIEAWTYDFNTNTWRNMTPAEAPRSRSGHKMVYDSESDRVIMFGGAADIGPRDVTFGDTWAYDLNTNTWANLTPPTTTTTTTTATTTTTTTTLPTETTTTFPPSQAVSTTTIGIGAVLAIATVLAIYLLRRKK